MSTRRWAMGVSALAITVFALGGIAVASGALTGGWVQVGDDLDTDFGDELKGAGWSVALSQDGGSAAVGFSSADETSTDIGKVGVFDHDGTGWTQRGEIMAGGLTGIGLGDLFGYSMAISGDGNTVIAGAPGNPVTPGYARVLTWDGTNWRQLGDDLVGEDDGYYGFSVDISGEGRTVVVGDVLNSGNGFAAGHARVFDWNGTQWTQVGADFDGDPGDQAGRHVAISDDGNTVAVSAPHHGAGIGRVRIFSRTGNTWSPLGAGVTGIGAVDSLGLQLALSGDGATVAVATGTSADTNDGYVRVFDWDGSAWNRVGSGANGSQALDRINSLGLSADGRRVIVGSSGQFEPYRVAIFDWTEASWEQAGLALSGDSHSNSFGGSVAISGDGSRVIVGDPARSIPFVGSGHAQVFAFDPAAALAAIGGSVIAADGTPAAVKVDLFEANDLGGRERFLAFANTGPDGGYRFEGLAPGCYILTFIAPDGQSFSGSRWFQPTACVGAGEQRLDINATLDPEPEPGLSSINGMVRFDDGAQAAGVKIDLFEAGPSGSRVRFIGATRTFGDGTFAFDGLEPDCYTLTFIAPADASFSGRRWYQPTRCVEAGTAVEVNAVLVPGDRIGAIGGTVRNSDASPEAGAKVDLFETAADGSRGRFLGHRLTDDGGNFQFDVGGGCYTLTYIAPQGRSYNGSRWYQVARCIDAGQRLVNIDAVLD